MLWAQSMPPMNSPIIVGAARGPIECVVTSYQSMIRKSVKWFSERIMRDQNLKSAMAIQLDHIAL